MNDEFITVEVLIVR